MLAYSLRGKRWTSTHKARFEATRSRMYKLQSFDPSRQVPGLPTTTAVEMIAIIHRINATFAAIKQPVWSFSSGGRAVPIGLLPQEAIAWRIKYKAEEPH